MLLSYGIQNKFGLTIKYDFTLQITVISLLHVLKSRNYSLQSQ